jgi:DNA-binding CsgD family transcriptional regulator/tetratricopeptide (TPR) repeat protein
MVGARSYASDMLVGRTGLSPVMVGRAAELDRLAQLLGARRTPSVALVAAEAGVGKTRLVQELVARVPAGTVVLAGQADPGALGRPLELFLDSLDRVLLEPHADLLDVAGDRSRTAEERVRAGVDLVRRLTAAGTGLVVFEDLHWSDSESIALFEELAEPDSGRLLLVGTYRPDGLTRRHPAAELLPRLERRHSVTHLNLTPLSASDVGALLTAVYGRAPSFRVVEALHTRTGGNPFFLEELVATAGEIGIEDLCALPLPWTVAEVVRGQADDLAPDERRIVSAAAVLGRRVSFDLLAAVTGTSEERLIALLRELVGKGFLVETDPDVFGFRHELAREAIADALLGRERRRLHEAGLGALRAAGSTDYAAIARHARGAARFDDLVEVARCGAAEYLAVGSTYLALDLAELGLSEADDDLELRALAAEAAWLVGMAADAAEHADRWLALAREADQVTDLAAALALRTRLAMEYGEKDAAGALTDELISIVDNLPTDEQRARAMAAIAQSYMLRDQLDPTCEWADKATALADANDLPAIRLAAMVEKGSALMVDPGSEDHGRALLEAAATEAAELGERLIAARALNNLVWHARQWAPEEVRDRLERMRQHAEAAGSTSLASASYAEGGATLAAIEGDLDAAIAHLDKARRGDRGHVSAVKAEWFAIIQAGFALEAGDLDAAERYTREAKPIRPKTAVAVAGLDLNLALRRGNLPLARALLVAQQAAVDSRGWMAPDEAHDIVAAGLRAGLPIAELRPLTERLTRWGGRPLDPAAPWARLVAGQVAEADGDAEAAADGYVAAAHGLRPGDVELAGHRGTAHVGAARSLIALGRLDEARVHAERATELLARWRGWRVEELDAVRRRLGLGAELSGPDALTPREREVVGLLATGLTNSQLADRLYISPRTAAVHVSNILAKLGMSSRTEVAAWAVREGHTPDA